MKIQDIITDHTLVYILVKNLKPAQWIPMMTYLSLFREGADVDHEDYGLSEEVYGIVELHIDDLNDKTVII